LVGCEPLAIVRGGAVGVVRVISVARAIAIARARSVH